MSNNFEDYNFQFGSPNKDLTHNFYLEFNIDNFNESIHPNISENFKTGWETQPNEILKDDIIPNVSEKKKTPKFITSKKKLLGRKKKGLGEKGQHNEYDGDNIIRKIKSLIIKLLIKFINQLIVCIYDGKIGFGPLKKKICTLNQEQIIDSKYDKQFIMKTLKEILSVKITGKISSFEPGHNRKVIELLLNEEDASKRQKFEEFFNLKFIDCIWHFSGKNEQSILIGMETMEKACDNFRKDGRDERYIKTFTDYVENFSNIIQEKKNRQSKK